MFKKKVEPYEPVLLEYLSLPPKWRKSGPVRSQRQWGMFLWPLTLRYLFTLLLAVLRKTRPNWLICQNGEESYLQYYVWRACTIDKVKNATYVCLLIHQFQVFEKSELMWIHLFSEKKDAPFFKKWTAFSLKRDEVILIRIFQLGIIVVEYNRVSVEKWYRILQR